MNFLVKALKPITNVISPAPKRRKKRKAVSKKRRVYSGWGNSSGSRKGRRRVYKSRGTF